MSRLAVIVKRARVLIFAIWHRRTEGLALPVAIVATPVDSFIVGPCDARPLSRRREVSKLCFACELDRRFRFGDPVVTRIRVPGG